MTREERNEFNYIRRTLRSLMPIHGATLTIRTDGSPEYKHALHDYYTGLGFHPAAIRRDPVRFDGKERIEYIANRIFLENGMLRPWTDFYTARAQEAFRRALD